MKKIVITAGIISSICIVFLIFLTAVRIPSFSMWFYRWQFAQNDTYAVVNMEPEHLHDVTRHMIRHMQGREDDIQILTIVGGEERYFFSPIEIRHMDDVQVLFRWGLGLYNVLLALFILSLAVYLIWGRKIWARDYLSKLFRTWRTAAFAFALGLIVLAVAIAVNWHRAFIIFHEIFFNNDYWILDPRVDLLINIVPYPFFIAVTAFIGGFLAFGLAVLIALPMVVNRRR